VVRPSGANFWTPCIISSTVMFLLEAIKRNNATGRCVFSISGLYPCLGTKEKNTETCIQDALVQPLLYVLVEALCYKQKGRGFESR
jgi:hypothetical protein